MQSITTAQRQKHQKHCYWNWNLKLCTCAYFSVSNKIVPICVSNYRRVHIQFLFAICHRLQYFPGWGRTSLSRSRQKHITVYIMHFKLSKSSIQLLLLSLFVCLLCFFFTEIWNEFIPWRIIHRIKVFYVLEHVSLHFFLLLHNLINFFLQNEREKPKIIRTNNTSTCIEWRRKRNLRTKQKKK